MFLSTWAVGKLTYWMRLSAGKQSSVSTGSISQNLLDRMLWGVIVLVSLPPNRSNAMDRTFKDDSDMALALQERCPEALRSGLPCLNTTATGHAFTVEVDTTKITDPKL